MIYRQGVAKNQDKDDHESWFCCIPFLEQNFVICHENLNGSNSVFGNGPVNSTVEFGMWSTNNSDSQSQFAIHNSFMNAVNVSCFPPQSHRWEQRGTQDAREDGLEGGQRSWQERCWHQRTSKLYSWNGFYNMEVCETKLQRIWLVVERIYATDSDISYFLYFLI